MEEDRRFLLDAGLSTTMKLSRLRLALDDLLDDMVGKRFRSMQLAL